jgi:hypothetical protein
MLNVSKKIISLLKADSSLTTIVSASNMFVGPTDIVEEKMSELYMPQINVQQIGETSRTVPSGVRDTILQLDVWSMNSQLEVENISEIIIPLLNYEITDESTSHIYWLRMSGNADQYETDRRIWHRAIRFNVWCQ